MKKILPLIVCHILSFHFYAQNIITIEAPSDMVISCKFDYPIDEMKEASSNIFGKVVQDISQRNRLVTYDIVCKSFCDKDMITGYPGDLSSSGPGSAVSPCTQFYMNFDSTKPDKKFYLNWGFDGFVTSVLNTKITVEINNQQKHQKGLIERIFIAKDSAGNEARDTQKIWVINCGVFFINQDNLCDPNDDLITAFCDTIISEYGCSPITDKNPFKDFMIKSTGCTLMAYSYTDQTLALEKNEYCLKILRTHTLVDWNQYNPFNSPTIGKWSFVQIIYLKDKDKPKIEIKSDFCSEVNASNRGRIKFEFVAYDSCSPTDFLKFAYYVDLNNDQLGKYDKQYDIFSDWQSLRDLNAGTPPSLFDNPYAMFANNSLDASGDYPLGKHRLRLLCQDGCGNIAEAVSIFEILDSKKPEIQCITAPINLMMTSKGFIEVFAKDFIELANDNCTPKKALTITMNNASSLASDIITCADIKNSSSGQNLIKNYTITATDKVGNSTQCNVSVDYQDINGNCLAKKSFAGEFFTPTRRPIERVFVTALSPNGMVDYHNACDNDFAVTSIGGNNEIAVNFQKIDTTNNGIDVHDLYCISNHILGVKILNRFQQVAADYNNSSVITAADISEMRKRILFVTNKPNQSKWEFYDSINLSLNSTILHTPYTPIIGYRIGDVDDNANLKCADSMMLDLPDLALVPDDHNLKAGEKSTIHFRVQDFKNIEGFQASLHWDISKLKVLSIGDVLSKFSKAIFNQNLLAQGIITFAAFQEYNTISSLSPNDILFSVDVEALVDISTKELFYFDSKPTRNIIYQSSGKIWEFNTKNFLSSSDDFNNEVFSVYPNPSSDGFTLQTNTRDKFIMIELYSSAGKLIHQEQVLRQASYELNPAWFKTSGIYHLRIQTSHGIQSLRLVKI